MITKYATEYGMQIGITEVEYNDLQDSIEALSEELEIRKKRILSQEEKKIIRLALKNFQFYIESEMLEKLLKLLK